MTFLKYSFLIFSLKFSFICSTIIFDVEIANDIDYNEIDQTYEEFSVSESFQIDFQKWKSEKPRAEDSLPTLDMIQSYGYPAEIHKVKTKDGYINTLHRIPPKGNFQNLHFFRHSNQ